MNTEERLQNYLTNAPRNWSQCVPSITCEDGFMMSVQASEHHYCHPRINHGPWEKVEVGFPSKIEPLLWDYAEDRGDLTSTVYPYVPTKLVAAVIEVHGGFSVQNDPPP